MKVCKTCGLKKQFSEYTKHHTNLDGVSGSCTVCLRAKRRAAYAANPAKALQRSRAWAKANPERMRELNARHAPKRKANLYWYHIENRCGLTKAQYLQMMVDQNHSCAICLKPNNLSKKMHVDHDHATGLVRGLLCSHCNHLLGHAKDQPTILLNAIAYLKRTEK